MAGELFKVALSTLLLFILVDGSDITCTPDSNNPCVCKGSGFTIDISKLLKFPVTISDSTDKQFKYEVDLCHGVTCTDGNTYIGCQKGATLHQKSHDFGLGKLSKANWTVTKTSPLHFQVKYSGGESSQPIDGGQDVARSAIFIFDQKKSNKKSSIAFDKSDDDTLVYTFDADISSGSGGSTGSKVGIIGLVLIILILVAVVVYLVGGGVYMYKFRGARGAEVIPNWMFWKELPFVVKDGCAFTFGPCVRKIRGDHYSYEKI